MSASILTVIGARPQFIKAATVSRSFESHPDIEEILVHTGQHFDANMSEVFFDELNIPRPAYNLGVAGGQHGAMTARMLEKLELIILDRQPDAVLVYGDTNSTLAGALAASKLHIPVAHVEAGLRSFNRKMPEEINRVLTDHVSSFLFCPTNAAVANLRDEGINSGVEQVGDVMYDATIYAIDHADRTESILAKLGIEAGQFALATVHRAENTSSPDALTAVLDYIKQSVADTPVVLPLHPRTRKSAEDFGIDFDTIRVCDPISYLEMTQLLRGCTLVLTDSGGLQKEAYFHRRPCITLRNETEWVETIEAGWNRLWIDNDWKPRREINEYGSGDAAMTITQSLANLLS